MITRYCRRLDLVNLCTQCGGWISHTDKLCLAWMRAAADQGHMKLLHEAIVEQARKVGTDPGGAIRAAAELRRCQDHFLRHKKNRP